MTDFGERFRSARLKRGLKLDEVAHALYIRESFLRALEDEQWDKLPEEPYARGLVKNYASFLGLDVEQNLTEFAQLHPGLGAPDVFSQLDEPIVDHGRSHRHTNRSIVGVILGIAVLFAAWSAFSYFYLGTDPLDIFRMASTPQATVAPSSEPTTESTALPATTAAPTRSARATATPPSATPTPEKTVAAVSIILNAQVECWTEVVVDGETVFSGTLQPGASIEYSAESEIELNLGNAGGVTLIVNGTDRGIPGESGQVVNLTFGPDS